MTDNKWHLSKTINVGHLMTTVGVLAALFVFVNKFDQRMTILEVNQKNMVTQQERDRGNDRELFKEMRADSKEMRVDIKNILQRLGG